MTVGVGLSANVSFSAPGEDQPTDPGDTGAFLVIAEVDSDGTGDTHSGDVTVTASVDRGTARFEKIALYLDGVEVDSQSFGAPASEPADEPEGGDDPAMAAAQQTIEIKLGFNSAEYDLHDDHIHVDHMNGEHTLQVGLTVQGSTDEIFSNQREIEIENEDGVHLAVSGQTRLPVIGEDGGYWYGGPGAGFSLAAHPVVYSGRPITSVTLRTGFCGANDDAADAEAPYEFTPDCDGYEGPVNPNSFNIGPSPVSTLNATDEIFAIQIDYAGPGAPVFRPNPNDREGGWINDAVGLTAKHVTSGSSKNLDGWLFYGDKDAGVGGYTVQMQVGEDIEEALAATASASPTLPADSKKNDAYCFVASAVDNLGNRSELPDEDDGCADPADSQLAMDAVEDDPDTEDDESMDAVMAVLFSSIEAGVDTEAPTLVFTGASAGAGTSDGPDRAATLESEFEVQVKDNDDGSGVHGAEPVLATLEIRDADGAECRELGDLGEKDSKCTMTAEGLIQAMPLVRTSGVSALTEAGYYTFAALAHDKAGNQSAEMSEVAIYDNEEPVVQVTTTRSTDFDEDFTLNKVLVATDNLSLRDYTVNLVAAAALDLGANIPDTFAMGSNAWDAYNASSLTRDDVVRGPIELPFIAVQTTTAGAPTGDPNVIENTRVEIRDQVDGRTPADPDPTSDEALTGITAETADGFLSAFTADGSDRSRTNVKAFAVGRGSSNEVADSKSSVKLTATAVVIGKVQIVTTTETNAAGEAQDPTFAVTDATADDPALGTTTVITQNGATVTTPEEGTAYTTAVTEVKTLPNPFSSVRFYATDDGGDSDGSGTEDLADASELRLIASVPAVRADVETVTTAGTPTGSALRDRVWTYEITVSADDYYAMVDGDGAYVGSILAVGVNENDNGVALASEAVVLNFEER